MKDHFHSFRVFRSAATSVPVAAGLLMTLGRVCAQESGSGLYANQSILVTPRISITETYTDNIRLSNVDRQAELVTEVSPGIRIVVKRPRLKSYFDYSLSEVLYAKNSSSRRTQNALNTFGTLEAINNWAFLDFSGSISRQAISAFGTQSSDNTLINSNQAEVATYRISPYVRGRLGNVANYEVRYVQGLTHSNAALSSDVKTTEAIGRVNGDTAFRNLGWLVDTTRQRVTYSAGRTSEADRFKLGLSYTITPQLNVLANVGREANNYTTLDKQTYAVGGYGLRWSPSDRTKVSASRDHLSFGNAHSLSLEHRTARTAWRFSDTKGTSVTPAQTRVASAGLNFDILNSQFESVEPDPVARAQLVNAYLQANGINPNAAAIRGFLTSALSLERRQELMFALLGMRDTITFIATRSESRRLDTFSTGVDDLAAASQVRLRGFSANYAHRLTPDYSLGLIASQQNTSGSSSLQETRLRTVNVNVTGKFGRKTFGSVGARHNIFSGGNTASYKESAIFANLAVQF